MAKIRVTGKGIHGHYAFEGEVAEEHAAAVIALVVEKAHGGAVPVPPSPRSPEGRKVAGKALSDFRTGQNCPCRNMRLAPCGRKIPMMGQVEQFILKQSERRDSHPLVAREFFGRTVHMAKDSSRAEKRLFYILHLVYRGGPPQNREEGPERQVHAGQCGVRSPPGVPVGTGGISRWVVSGNRVGGWLRSVDSAGLLIPNPSWSSPV